MAEHICTCNHWPEWVSDPFLPIWFNSRMNEYVLNAGKKAEYSFVIYYCPVCGGKMPESRRGEFFTNPSEDEMAEARTLLEGIIDADTMRSVLGEPDQIIDAPNDDLDDPLRGVSILKIKRQYNYTSRWKTLRLGIQETENGHLVFSFCDQEKDPDKL